MIPPEHTQNTIMFIPVVTPSRNFQIFEEIYKAGYDIQQIRNAELMHILGSTIPSERSCGSTLEGC